MIEKQLCRKMNITEQMVDAWDLAHEDEDEPGAMEGCPYREAHLIAEGIERAVAVKLGVDWDHYEKTIHSIMSNCLPPPDPTVRDVPHGYVSEKDGRQPARNRNKVARGKVRERSVLKGT